MVWTHFEHLIMYLTRYLRKPPGHSICCQKRPILPLIFAQIEKIQTLGQHLLTKIFIEKDIPELSLNDHNFEIFILQILAEIFSFQFSMIEGRILK